MEDKGILPATRCSYLKIMGSLQDHPVNEVNLPYTDTQSNCQKLGICVPFWFSKHFVPSAELGAIVDIKETIIWSVLLASNGLTKEIGMDTQSN